MRKKWTELELTIVYYVTRYGAHGYLKKEDGAFMNSREICDYLGHGEASYLHCKDKFRYAMGYKITNSANAYNPSVAQRTIVKKYANKTISQMRTIISDYELEVVVYGEVMNLPKHELEIKEVETEHKDQYKLDL